MALERLGRDGQLDGRGVTFKPELLERLLKAIEGPFLSIAQFERAIFVGDAAAFAGTEFRGAAAFSGATFKGNAPFSGATFKGNAWFDGAKFTCNAWFDGATFMGNASFDEATFTGDTSFHRATFVGDAWFDRATLGNAWFEPATFKANASFKGATFERNAWFNGATFNGDASFSEATFVGDAWFDRATLGNAWLNEAEFTCNASFDEAIFTNDTSFHGATFVGEAMFRGAKFTGRAWFDPATFTCNASFAGATFVGDAWFHGAKFTCNAWFDGATFERARQLGPMVVRESLVLDGAFFRERIQVEVSAAVLFCRRARFLAGVKLQVRWAQVVLDDADLSAPSVLSGASRFAGLDEGDWPRTEGSAWPADPYGTPRLLSMRGADVAGLVVTRVDLRACRFVDAYHLDHLQTQGSYFARTPPDWRWTTRRTIAEEHQWRASEGRRGWYGPEIQPPEWDEVKERTAGQAGLLHPGEIAALYRDLRKGLEDSKDESGAEDFRYGEMEMRRQDKRQQLEPRSSPYRFSAAAEAAVMWFAWLVSGYGLRSWRTLASLAAVVLVASVALAFLGFRADAGLDELSTALRVSSQSVIPAMDSDPGPLTPVGEWVHMTLRVIGPALLGLAGVLSLRALVKR